MVDGLVPSILVGIQRGAGRVEALLPFRRDRYLGRPPAAGINDAHGILNSNAIDTDEFIRGCGLSSFHYHASPPNLQGVPESEVGRSKSFLADLTACPGSYVEYLLEASRTIAKQAQKTRKLERQHGPLRFEFDCRDPQMIDWLVGQKRNQYQRTHTFDIFSKAWIPILLQHLHRLGEDVQDDKALRGLLSVLYAGNQPVAAHYGLLEGDNLHYWFPVYDPNFHFASPGTQLFLDVVEAAEAMGLKSIDMGYGEQAYKHKLTNVVTEMSYGTLGNSMFGKALTKASHVLGEQFKASGIRNRLKPYARKVMPWFGGGKYTK